jgi:hypothetical protein
MRGQQFVKCDVALVELLIPVQCHDALSPLFNKNDGIEQTGDTLWHQN